MKRAVVAILAVVLLLALAMPALADTMYTTKSVKVYEEPDKHSRVTLTLEAAHEVEVYDYEDGFYECKYGWIQEKYLSYEYPQSRCHHEWGDWEVQRYATCTQSGYKTRYCLKCGIMDEKDIPKTGHDWGKWKVTKEATCTRQGTRTRTCHNCGEQQKENYYADHEYGAWTTLREPTCTSTGLRSHTCLNCGKEETQSIDKLPHSFEYRIIVEATDHSSGTRASVCTVCGYSEGEKSYDPEGTLRRSDRGEAVRQLQGLLVDQGYLNVGGADGIFGGGTEKAVMKFQADQGLTVDGVAWPQTQKRLSHDFGPWETVVPMTRTTPGVRQRTCKDCGYVQTETVEMGDVIERGARGENVRALQQMIKQMGYDAGSFDGIYGKKLDNAFAKFEADCGMIFEEGKVRPADVDALVSAWLAMSATPLTEGGVDSPVNLALTVLPSTDFKADSEVTTYSWTLYNLGTEKCMFNALLLTYGSTPDFSGDDLVMVLDGEELKPNSGNSVSGSFSVAESWGEGSLNFAAMAVSESTGAKWLSNTVTFGSTSQLAPKSVEPVPAELNVAALEDGTYPVSFDRGDIAGVTSGIYLNAVHFYTMDTYNASDIEGLASGDSVVVEGIDVEVETVEERDGAIIVNGGNDAGGCEFVPTEDGGAWRVRQYDDHATYTEHGMTTVMAAPTARFVDASDPDAGEVVAGYDELVNAILMSTNESFNQYNTTVAIEGGQVVEIDRAYMP